MKTLNDYMAMSYRMEIVEDKDEGGFVVSYPDLPGCITCGETVESAVANALDAKKAWIEAASGCWETKWVYGASRFQTPTMTVSEMRRRSPCFGNVSDGPWTLSKPAMALRNCMYFRLCPLLPQSSLAEFGCLKRICP